jgi:peptidoglycan/xylan/chitin deacetylase (PgdA/CDA1 family)
VIRILTYHKVCPGETISSPDFYTTCAARLRDHIFMMHDCGMIGVAPQIACTPPGAGSASFLLCFDDGTEDHFNVVLPVLAEFGLRGTFFVPTSKLDRPGYLTRTQLSELARHGHLIGLHGHAHKRLDRESPASQQFQLETSRRIISDITGTIPDFFAPPGGYTNSGLRRVAVECGIRSIRTMRWGYNHQLKPLALQTIPINRHVDAPGFKKLIEPGLHELAYLSKECVKYCMPIAGYETLRQFIFRKLRRT